MPERDPAEWFERFLVVHMARFPAYPWPVPETPEFADLVTGWVYHFRREEVTQDRANRASLALMRVKHFPNNHLAEFFEAMPEAPVEYARPDPRAAGHWKSGPKIWPEPRRGGGGAE